MTGRLVRCAALALVVLVALSACSKSKSSGTAASPGGGGEAGYFFDRRTKLAPAPADLAGAFKLGLQSWSQASGPRGPDAPGLTLQVSLAYQGQGRDIVVLDVIPWKLGDTEKGPGATLTKTTRQGVLLRSGERAIVDVPVVVKRVDGAPATSAPPTSLAPLPGPSTPRSLGGTGLLAAGRLAQEQPQPSPPVTTAPRPLPSVTPAGPTLPPKGGPFDPDAGLQVILVVAYVGEGVSPDAYKNVSLVDDSQFSATYGRYFRVEQGIAVPIDRLI